MSCTIVKNFHRFPRYLFVLPLYGGKFGCSYSVRSNDLSHYIGCHSGRRTRSHCLVLGPFAHGWRCNSFHRTILTVALYHSRNYPDFFNESKSSTGNSVTNSKTLLETLEAANERKYFGRGIQAFESFRKEKPDWFKQWPAQKITALVFHLHFQAGSFREILVLYDELRSNGFVHGEGIYVTLIKTCIAMNNVPSALNFLEDLKKIGLRNIRIYRPLIMALIKDDRLDLAFQLFKELQYFEFSQKTKKQFKDQEMLSSLLISAATEESKYIDKNNANRKLRSEMVCNVLQYLSTRRIVVSTTLKNAIMQAVNSFVEEYSLEIVNHGQFKREPQDLKEFKSDIANEADVESFVNLLSLSKKGFHYMVEEDLLRDLIAKSGPFSTIIDGANVMLASKDLVKNKHTKMNERNLIDLLHCYKQSFHLEKPLIILPSAMEKRSIFTKSTFFKQVSEEYYAEVFVTKHIADDVALLLATLYNDACLINRGLNPYTTLVSNDSLREHVSVAGQEQFKLNLWLQSKQLKFSWDFKDDIVIQDRSLPVSKASDNWSLHVCDGQVMEITKL